MTNHQKLSSCDIPLSWPGANNLTELLAQVICWQCRALQLAKQNERGATRRGRLVLLCWLRMLLSVWCLPQALNMFSPILFGKKKVRVIFFLLPPFLISLFFFFSYYCNCFQKTLTFRLLPCALFQRAQCCFFDMHKSLVFLACADGAWTRNWEVFILMIGAWLSCIPEPSWALGEECLPGLFLAASVRWAEPQ